MTSERTNKMLRLVTNDDPAVVNFEFVESCGIHPFYLGMTLDKVIEVATDWMIVSTEREADLDLKISLEMDGKQIEVGFLNVRAGVTDAKSHYQAYSIDTYDAVLPNGGAISDMDPDGLLRTVFREYEFDDLDLRDEDGEMLDVDFKTYKSGDDINSVTFTNGEKTQVSLCQVPPIEEA